MISISTGSITHDVVLDTPEKIKSFIKAAEASERAVKAEKRTKLTPYHVRAIDKILESGNDAKVSTDKNGIAVYELRTRKIHTDTQP